MHQYRWSHPGRLPSAGFNSTICAFVNLLADGELSKNTQAPHLRVGINHPSVRAHAFALNSIAKTPDIL